MKILIVSGFLGAGKTTFIKELIRQSGVSPVVLENEYGENNLDSKELGQLGNMKILEFMEGCVCCTQKDSFANTILAISAGLDPEYLVVEPTGVGKLSNIIQNIQQVSYDKIRLLKSVVVLSPNSFAQNMRDWPNIYRDQILHTDIVVFSKVEHALPEQIEEVTRKIQELNPQAEIIRESYHKQPPEWWKGLLEMEGNLQKDSEIGGEMDSISQFSLQEAHLANVGELSVLLEDVLRGEFGCIVRAKGTLKVGDEMLRFDLADRLYMVSGAPEGETKTQCVFIGGKINRRAICKRMHTTLRQSRVYIPKGQTRQKRIEIKETRRG